MKYSEFLSRNHFVKEDILSFANGTLYEDAPSDFTARLPLPPMVSSRGWRPGMAAGWAA